MKASGGRPLPDYVTAELLPSFVVASSAASASSSAQDVDGLATFTTSSSTTTTAADIPPDNHRRHYHGHHNHNHQHSIPPSLHLPTHWNPKDKCAHLELASSRQNLKVTYVGPGKSDSDAAAVRANCPMPKQLGLFYYEVTVVSKGRDGYIAVGFCAPGVSLMRLPGWETNSWGYHGDDGHSFQCSGTGRPFGPTFTTGDTVGCGVNFLTRESFYTKNGILLGTAFRELKHLDLLYPCVGLRTVGEQIEANFGQKPFKFDVVEYIRGEKVKLLSTIQESMAINSNTLETEESSLRVTDKIVLSYLLHHGFVETADALAKSLGAQQSPQHIHQLQAQLHDASRRREIYEHVLQGRMDEAISMAQRFFPDALEANDEVYFQIRCRKFVEMIAESSNSSDGMDLDGDQHQQHQQQQHQHQQQQQQPEGMDEEFEAMQEALLYGQRLQEDYRNDDRVSVQNKLVETFSLLAYPDLAQSPVARLLHPRNRAPVAEALDRLLLANKGLPARSSLETMYRQTIATLAEMFHEGMSGPSLLDPERILF